MSLRGSMESPELLEFKVCDSTRQRSGVLAVSCLDDLVMQASEVLDVQGPVSRVCLEQDGTEVDEEEYFGTLEPGTALMVLQEGDRWLPPGAQARYELLLEEERSARTPPTPQDDLELLSNMDPDSLTDIVPDKLFLEAVRDACVSCKILPEKREVVNSL